MSRPNDLLEILVDAPHRRGRVTHVEPLPPRSGHRSAWPEWLDPVVEERVRRVGVTAPWTHQAEAASLAWTGKSIVMATGTASGKSLGYLLPALTAARRGRRRGSATLYISPTKALAADQLQTLRALDVPDVVTAAYDGDTPIELRDLARARATYLLTNPDMLHHALLPAHRRWAEFLRSLRFIVVDECHSYRGVFGSHVAQVLRRLRRLCAHYGAEPTFILASATTADPARTAEILTGVPVQAVTADGSPGGAKTFVLWEPELGPATMGNRGVLADTAHLLADLVGAGARTVAFVRSRRAAETVADQARAALQSASPGLAARVVSYRAGYLAHERRALESALNDGTVLGVAATTALELGVDVGGLDAVLIAGWPGTRASLWQQAGRAGRAGQKSLAVLLASDDPLDSYLVRHPEAIFGQAIEATVMDPDNPYVLAPHLCAAAAEQPLSQTDVELFGPSSDDVLTTLERRRLLRRRVARADRPDRGSRRVRRDRSGQSTDQLSWHWTRRERAAAHADLRGSGHLIALVEQGTGRVLGTVDATRAHSTAHVGAVYVHQGETYVVDRLDLDEGVAMAHVDTPGYTTAARDVSTLTVLERTSSVEWGAARLTLGTVEVRSRVVSYLKRASGTDKVLGEVPLDLPERQLRTRAVWWQLPDEAVRAAGVDENAAAGAAHAAEHAAIGLLPLIANCDRWDIGGVSTVRHPDTDVLTVFVHDGHPGGAGFAERGYHAAASWLSATREAVATCPCAAGCPSCIQSPKCGNGNEPLNKVGAVRLLDAVLAAAGQVATVG